MEHFLYILFSQSKQRFYVGESHDTDKRLDRHNIHSYPGSFTKIANDWVIVLNYPCISKSDAVYLEKFVKRMKSKTFIAKIIGDPGILNDILDQR